jgi:hypothetical protein
MKYALLSLVVAFAVLGLTAVLIAGGGESLGWGLTASDVMAQSPAEAISGTPIVSETLLSFMLTPQDLPPGFALDEKLSQGWSTGGPVVLGMYHLQYKRIEGQANPSGFLVAGSLAVGAETPEAAAAGLPQLMSGVTSGLEGEGAIQISVPLLGDETIAHQAKLKPGGGTTEAEAFVIGFRKTNVVCVVFAGGLVGMGSIDEVVSMAKAMEAKVHPLTIPAKESTPAPTYTPYPTYTPTYTPRPTYTPYPTPSATATVPGLKQFSGRGDDVIVFESENGGLALFRITHAGESNFAVKLFAADGQYLDLLVNEIGSYDGKRVAPIPAGQYVLEITADGYWTIMVALPQ